MKDNKIDVEATTNLAKTKLVDEARVKKAHEIAQKCADQTDADRCVAATKIFACCHDVIRSLGISFQE